MKKWLLIGIVLLVTLSGVLAGCAEGGGKEEQASGTIQVPGGPKIKVVFNGPPELKVEWEKLGMADFFQVQLIGTLRNVSNQAVKFSEIGFLFDGYQVAFIGGRTLNPGEEMEIMKGFPGYTENTKVLEVKIKGFEKVGNPTVASTTVPTTPTSMPTQTAFTSTPGNPQTPEEVVAAFYFLLDKKEFLEAATALPPHKNKR